MKGSIMLHMDRAIEVEGKVYDMDCHEGTLKITIDGSDVTFFTTRAYLTNLRDMLTDYLETGEKAEFKYSQKEESDNE